MRRRVPRIHSPDENHLNVLGQAGHPACLTNRISLCSVCYPGCQQGTLSAVKRSAWPGRQCDERQLVEGLRVALPDIDEGGLRMVEIAEALGFGETTVRKLLRG